MGYRRFSDGFKEAIVKKMLSRGSQTIAEVCKQEGVGISTTTRWMSNCASVVVMKNSRNLDKWTAEEKYKILFQSNGLNEEELGAFLRKGGLHSHQLNEWREATLKVLGSKVGKNSIKKDERDQRIKELEKDLHRKDKALAEASALLILQKKVNLIWGHENEDEK